MIEKFDYLEPKCPLTKGKDFYYPDPDAPLGTVPVDRILRKADALFDKNNYAEAGRLLEYWRAEAVALKDKRGELSICSELVGFYRKQNDPENGILTADRALQLVQELEQGDLASGATVFINCATAYQSYGLMEDALPLFQQAEAVYKKRLPEGDARFGGLYNNMALTLTGLGQLSQAADAYRAALAVMERVPKGQAEQAITYINMAYLYRQLGEQTEIHRCMEKAYALLQSEALPRDGYYAFVLEKCAPAFRDFGDGETYARLKKKSEEIYAGT